MVTQSLLSPGNAMVGYWQVVAYQNKTLTVSISFNGEIKLESSTVIGDVSGRTGVTLENGSEANKVESTMGSVKLSRSTANEVDGYGNIILENDSKAGKIKSTRGHVELLGSKAIDVFGDLGVFLRENSSANNIKSKYKNISLTDSDATGDVSGKSVRAQRSTIEGLCKAEEEITAFNSTLKSCKAKGSISLTDCDVEGDVLSECLVNINCTNERRTYGEVKASRCEAHNCHIKSLTASEIQAHDDLHIDKLTIIVHGNCCVVDLSNTTINDEIIIRRFNEPSGTIAGGENH